MVIDRCYIQQHLTSAAILLFMIIYVGFIYAQPAFLYNKDGSLRVFGVGYKRKTVVPIWLLAIALAILSYYVVLYYVAYPKIWNL